MEIDHEAEKFPYQQLYDLLRQRIISGDIPPGRRIPSLVTIQQETGLATDTMRRAIRLLADDGLVRVIPGRGTFAASEMPRQPPVED